MRLAPAGRPPPVTVAATVPATGCGPWICPTRSAAARLAGEAWDALGHLDAVVNNAARPMRRPVQRLSMGVVEDLMRTNFFSPVALSLAAPSHACWSAIRGVIVNVGSLAGRVGSPAEAAYAASKCRAGTAGPR